MRGTGSKDLVVTDAFLPEHRVMPTYPTFLGLSPHAKARKGLFQLGESSGGSRMGLLNADGGSGVKRGGAKGWHAGDQAVTPYS